MIPGAAVSPHAADEVANALCLSLEVVGSPGGHGVGDPGAVCVPLLRDLIHIVAAAPHKCQRLS